MASCSTSRAKRALDIRFVNTALCALRIRLSAPTASMRRRICGSIIHIGVVKAFSSRNFTASFSRALTTGVIEDAGLADIFLLRVEAADDRGHVIHLQRPLAQHAAVEFGQILVRFAGLGRGCGQQHLGDALRDS